MQQSHYLDTANTDDGKARLDGPSSMHPTLRCMPYVDRLYVMQVAIYANTCTLLMQVQLQSNLCHGSLSQPGC